MIVIPGPIPIAIHPLFWIFAGLVGWIYGQNIAGALIWMGIIFFSVLIHEFGHALTAVCFRQKAKIQLVAFGGLTTYDSGPSLKFWQQFLIVLNGPLFGFGLCLLAFFLSKMALSPVGIYICKASFLANFLWSAANLLPVLPLDGGQLLRIVMEAFFALKGFRASLLISGILSLLLALAGFVTGYFIAGAFFFLFAFQNIDSWRKCKLATSDDRDAQNNSLMMRAEEALQEGKKEQAQKLFEEVASKSGSGILFIAANQYLAFFDMQQGKKEEAYQKLLPLKEQLAEESVCLLHQLAFEHANDELVADLSTRCYQIAPSQEVALRNAHSFAKLQQSAPAGGWLQTAWQHGVFNLEGVLKEPSFAKLQNDPVFLEFINPLRES